MSSLPRFGSLAAILFLTAFARAPAEASEHGHYVVDQATGFAAEGYDPVAYFVNREPRPGLVGQETNWQGVAWRFANEGNLAAFLHDPLIYAPKYGGHCAVALARGYPAEGDPRLWAIYQDRLYFFYSKANQKEFDSDPEAILAAADTSWAKLYPY